MIRAHLRGLAFAVAAMSTVANAQVAATAKTDTAAIVRRLMAGATYATLVTLDETGAPRSRTVQPRAPEADFSVWIATNPKTRKVTDIARDGRVVLHYFDPKRMGYVSIAGKARVVRDRAEKAGHWDKAWDSFYPDRDNGVVLIAVSPDRIEIVSDKDGITGDKASWRPPVFKPALTNSKR